MTLTPWLGTKRVAFVPLYRSITGADPPDVIPPDWENVIRNRVINDPNSLRAWLRGVSSGRADIEPMVLPMQTIDRQRVEPWDLDQRPWEGVTLGQFLHNQGVNAAILIMLGGRGSGTNQGFWSRAVMVEGNGVWLMELIHGLTGFGDLYHFDDDVDPPERAIGSFDEMSAATQTHPTAYTKSAVGWLDQEAIGLYNFHPGAVYDFRIRYISLIQPPPAGQVAAVRIPVRGPTGLPVIVEARKKTDQFDSGIPSEGVIAYRVQTRDPSGPHFYKLPLYQLTMTALRPGQSATLDRGVSLSVISENVDTIDVRITVPQVIGTTVPSVIGADPHGARLRIQQAFLVPSIIGGIRSSRIYKQEPLAGTGVNSGSTVKAWAKRGDEPPDDDNS